MFAPLLAALLSGIAGLAYQVAWTRLFASVTAATVTAQALVLAGFMGGLGLGAHLGGKWSQTLERPWRAYAGVETAAALLAFVSVPLMFSARDPGSVLGGLVAGSGAAGLTVTLALSTLFLLAVATLLGASLPLLIAGLPDRFGPSAVGWLYGINTLGAVLGCLFGGFFAIEAFGLTGTTRVGAGCALLAAIVATVFSAPRATPTVAATEVAAPVERDLLLIAGLAGFAGLAVEVVWTRLVAIVVLNTVYAFTQVLATVLLGVALGGIGAALLLRSKAAETPALLYRALGGALVAATIAMAASPLLLTAWVQDPASENALAAGVSFSSGLFVLLTILPASTCIAIALPALTSIAKARSRAESFGTLYAINTVGAVLGSVAAGFVLLPKLGAGGALLAVEAVTFIAALICLLRSGLSRRGIGLTAILGVVIALGARPNLARDIAELRAGAVEVLAFKEGIESNVMITEDGRKRRRIWLNSAWVAGTGGGHRVLGHLPPLFAKNNDKAMGIALGTGQTFAAAVAHGFKVLHCVELDSGVIELSTKWFREANGALFEKPNVRLHHNDGRAFLRATDDKFDLIILEPLQAWSIGTSNLYAVEFYEEAQRVLAPGGVVAQWIPFYGQKTPETKAMVRAALEVFPNSSLWLDDADGILISSDAPFAISLAEMNRRIGKRGIGPELAKNGVAHARELSALFLLGPEGLAKWTEGAPLLTDDHPFLEFAAARSVGKNEFRDILRSILPHIEKPATYATDTASVARAQIDGAATVRATALSAALLPDGAHLAKAKLIAKGLGSAPESQLLLHRYREFILRTAYDPRLTKHGPGAVEKLYKEAMAVAPSVGEFSINLAVLYLQTGRKDDGARTLQTVEDHPTVGAKARQILSELRAQPAPAAPTD